MVSFEERIRSEQKKYLILSLCFIVIPLIMCFLMIKNTQNGINSKETMFLEPIYIILFYFLFEGLTTTSFVRKIFKYQKAKRVEPLHAVVEDYIVTSYVRDHKRYFCPYLLVKELSTEKRYLTLKKYDLSFYQKNIAKTGEGDLTGVLRKDHSAVKIGDRVDIYLLETIHKEVSFTKSKGGNQIKINRKKIDITHKRSVDLETIKPVILYEGIVDIDIANI